MRELRKMSCNLFVEAVLIVSYITFCVMFFGADAKTTPC